jgi:hypothetical protein
MVVVCLGPRPARAADCPPSQLHFHGLSIETTAAVYDTSFGPAAGGVPDEDGYDLHQATLTVYHPASLVPTYVYASDLFDVMGVPPGTLLVVTVELAVDGWIATNGCGGSGCAGSVTGAIQTPVDSRQQFATANIYAAAKVPFTFVVHAQAELTAGTPVPIRFDLTGSRALGGSHYSDAHAHYQFLGLPQGAVVTSCQGYIDPSTPAGFATWGLLKSRYR